MRILSPPRRLLGTAATGASGAAVAKGVSAVTGSLLDQVSLHLPTSTPVKAPWARALLQTPSLAVVTGAVSGLVIGAGMSGERIELEPGFSWKKLLASPVVDLYNQGVGYTEKMNAARTFTDAALATASIGATLGRGAGGVQGAVGGGRLGWQLSGFASQKFMELAGEALPPQVKPLVPALIGVTCLVAGQMAGAGVGAAVGAATGWTLGAVSGGVYQTLVRT